MLRIPNFTLQTYSAIMQAPYNSQDTSEWVDWWDFCHAMTPSYTLSYRDVDARELGDYLDDHTPPGSVKVGEQSIPASRFLQYTKLGCPTLWTSTYYLWDVRDGAHGGIDIMLPQHTPITSFTDGVVIRVKERDGNPQNEGNCIVIKTGDGYAISYEHLETINVYKGQVIIQGQQIGTCGTTGNSTQYHLHLQVDKPNAPFHPYRSNNPDNMESWTIDPLPFLRAVSPQSPFTDLPYVSPYNEAILRLYAAGIVQGFNKRVYPDNALQRYEIALLIDRILLKYAIYDTLPIINPHYTPYLDVDGSDPELIIALERLQKHNVMKGHNQSFYPNNPLKGEELLALLGRVFYKLQDNPGSPRYKFYKAKFEQENLISHNWGYIDKAIPRKEVFLLIYWLLVRNGHIK